MNDYSGYLECDSRHPLVCATDYAEVPAIRHSLVKMVFTGDIQQVDQPYPDSQSDRLVYMIDRMRGQHLFAYINLVKGERSRLGEQASNQM